MPIFAMTTVFAAALAHEGSQSMADDISAESAGRHRPKTTTVFVAAFVAGAVAAVVVNRALDLHLAQSKPQVESEPIFVALRAMPQGSPVTVWDVALRDWPRAMLPTSALRAGDSFEGSVLKYPVREGQPLLAVQLMPAERTVETAPTAVEEAFVPPPQSEPVKHVVATTTPEANASQNAPEEAVPSDPTPPAASAAVPLEVAAVEAIDTAKSEPEQDPAPPTSRKRFELEPSEDASSTTTVRDEATPAEPSPASSEPQPTRVASDVEPLLDMPSRPAVDLEKIPSVMARSETPAEVSEVPTSVGPVRYLVVPERIARQADTSFVPPPAVEPGPEPTPSPTQPPAPTPTRSAQSSTPPVKGFPQRSGTPTTAARPTHQPKKPSSSSQPKQPQRASQSTQTPDRSRTETASKPREPMFPVLAAGLEAMGNRWRGSDDEAVATDQNQSQRRK